MKYIMHVIIQLFMYILAHTSSALVVRTYRAKMRCVQYSHTRIEFVKLQKDGLYIYTHAVVCVFIQ